MKKNIIDFNALLNKEDTENQTFGCRQKNPAICGNNLLPNFCAFVREDGIYMKPSRAWIKQYLLLK